MSELETERLGDELTIGLSKIFGDGSPTAVFSAPEKVGDSLIMTAAAWERIGGFGFGSGSGTDETGAEGGGSGGGGGGTAQGRPVAVVTVRPNGVVQVRPVIDFTKITVTLLLAAVGVWGALRR